MDAAKLQTIHIPENRRRRSNGSFWVILLFVVGATGAALYFANPWAKDARDTPKNVPANASASANPSTGSPAPARPLPSKAPEAKPGDSVLTVSGYIINRERIEVSPRVM